MNKWPQFVELSRYFPILTTIISAAFAWIILARYRRKRQSYHLLWWEIGIHWSGGYVRDVVSQKKSMPKDSVRIADATSTRRTEDPHN